MKILLENPKHLVLFKIYILKIKKLINSSKAYLENFNILGTFSTQKIFSNTLNLIYEELKNSFEQNIKFLNLKKK